MLFWSKVKIATVAVAGAAILSGSGLAVVAQYNRDRVDPHQAPSRSAAEPDRSAPEIATDMPMKIPSLSEERLLFTSDELKEIGANRWLNTIPAWLLVRISPDGQRLLYSRPTGPVPEEGRYDGTHSLWLREIDSGRDIPVDVPSYPQGYDNVHIRLNPFDATGTRMALTAMRNEGESELVIIDIGKNTQIPTGIKASMIMAQFDWTGTRLLAVVIDRRAAVRDLLAIELPGLKRRNLYLGLSSRAYPTSVCPTEDIVCFFDVEPLPRDQRRGENRRRTRSRIALYDMQNGKKIVDLPTNEKNTQLDDITSVWTSDGRYVCYYDEGRDPDKLKGTRTWDRVGKREMKFIPGTAPMGTGPTTSQMVLVSTQKGDNRAILMDVPSGKTWPLSDQKTRLLHAAGGKIAFLKFLSDGRTELRVANLTFEDTGVAEAEKR